MVIVNFNAGEILAHCVSSVLNNKPSAELIVIDNDSQDGSLEYLEELFPVAAVSGLPNQDHDVARIKVIRNHNNVGFATAVNQGIRTASGDHIAVLNPDSIVEPTLFKKLETVLESNPCAGMVGPLIVNPDGSEQAGCRRDVPTPWRSFLRASGLWRLGRWWPQWFADFSLHHSPLPARAVEVEAISGACMYVRREALEEVGLMDENYFLHCEDLDWCMRFRERGWKILFVPGTVVVHHKGSCSKTRPIRVEWYKHCGMVRFHNKFFGKQYPALMTGLVWVGTWLHFALVSAYYGWQQGLRWLRGAHD